MTLERVSFVGTCPVNQAVTGGGEEKCIVQNITGCSLDQGGENNSSNLLFYQKFHGSLRKASAYPYTASIFSTQLSLFIIKLIWIPIPSPYPSLPNNEIPTSDNWFLITPMLPSPTSLILVAVMNKPRDLEIARLLGWYRIPLRSAPKVIAIDYLAFYQTGAFGDEKWLIRYVAPVLGNELTTRAELLHDEQDHPRSREEYFKVQIGPLIPLPKPVVSEKWHRLTFLYTTGEYLLNAGSINELVVRSDERQYLWQALRERAEKGQEYNVEDMPSFDIEPALLAALLGIKDA